jgi:hypothetical protein
MTKLVALLSGFCLTLIVFGGGGLTAIYFVNAKPVDVHQIDEDSGALWTSKAVSVNAAAQDLERLPARPVPQQTRQERNEPRSLDTEASDNAGSIDPTTTAAVSTQLEPQPAMSAAHVEWCSERYRSYDPADNSYNAYSGVRRQCVSPYSGDGSGPGAVNASAEEPAELISVAHSKAMPRPADSEHAQYCYERYQSYRPEDNTYQPYGGGPRQQCE